MSVTRWKISCVSVIISIKLLSERPVRRVQVARSENPCDPSQCDYPGKAKGRWSMHVGVAQSSIASNPLLIRVRENAGPLLD